MKTVFLVLSGTIDEGNHCLGVYAALEPAIDHLKIIKTNIRKREKLKGYWKKPFYGEDQYWELGKNCVEIQEHDIK